MTPYSMNELREMVTPIAKKHGVKRVAVFGSYSQNQATENSDVDLYLEKGQIRSLLQLLAFQLDVEERLKLRVDLVTNGTQDKAFLESIRPDEVTLYEQ